MPLFSFSSSSRWISLTNCVHSRAPGASHLPSHSNSRLCLLWQPKICFFFLHLSVRRIAKAVDEQWISSGSEFGIAIDHTVYYRISVTLLQHIVWWTHAEVWNIYHFHHKNRKNLLLHHKIFESQHSAVCSLFSKYFVPPPSLPPLSPHLSEMIVIISECVARQVTESWTVSCNCIDTLFFSSSLRHCILGSVVVPSVSPRSWYTQWKPRYLTMATGRCGGNGRWRRRRHRLNKTKKKKTIFNWRLCWMKSINFNGLTARNMFCQTNETAEQRQQQNRNETEEKRTRYD